VETIQCLFYAVTDGDGGCRL